MRLRRPFTRLVALGLVLGLLGFQSMARAVSLERSYIAIRYDLDRPDANPVFCVSKGMNGAIGPTWGDILGKVITSGSSTTVTAQDAVTETPFRDRAVGDILRVQRVLGTGTVLDYAVITAKASSTSITVDPAVNWQNGTTGYKANFRQPVCGQAITDGWFSVATWEDFTVVVQFQQGDLGGGLSWMVQCRDGGDDATPVQVFPATLGSYQVIATASATALTASNALAGFERWNECRVALLATSADASDAGANLERIRVIAIGTVRN